MEEDEDIIFNFSFLITWYLFYKGTAINKFFINFCFIHFYHFDSGFLTKLLSVKY